MRTKSSQLILKDMDISKREAVIAHATYKTLDSDQDRANRGMFDKSWKENFNILRVFVNHKKDQAPGKPLQTWDDNEHAYTRVKFGTHTLGNDTLLQLDEGIIVAASYGFEPVRFKEIKGKGLDFMEVKHYETSVLTHWGAHEDSGIVSVTKALQSADAPKISLKQLSGQEQGLLTNLISAGMVSLQDMVQMAMGMDTESDLYTWIMWMISRHADMMGDLRSRLYYGMKDQDMAAHVLKLQKFVRNGTASDECIRGIEKSLKSLINKDSDTATTHVSMVKCSKCATHAVPVTDESGRTQCAECGHVIKSNGAPGASRSNGSDELRKKAALLRLQLQLQED